MKLKNNNEMTQIKPILLATTIAAVILSGNVLATTLTVSGNSGNNGSSGASGNPGADGHNGSAGQDKSFVLSSTDTTESSNTLTVYAGKGGYGGNGGAGLPASAGSNGGNGGNGAKGGAATATSEVHKTTTSTDDLSATAIARGYPGGNGGTGGYAYEPGTPGSGGNGGNGGNAIANATASGGAKATVLSTARAGYAGREGHAGAIYSYSNDPALTFSNFGSSANAGHAFAGATGSGTTDINIQSYAYAGSAIFRPSGMAGHGGNATITGINGESLGSGIVSVYGKASAGNGADTIIGTAGSGGNAGFSGVVYGKSDNGGNVTATAQGVAGRGGVNRTSRNGNSGNGGETHLSNAVNGQTTGNLHLIQSARGGGAGRSNGSGSIGIAGTASSDLNKTTSQAHSLRIDNSATAGRGGDRDGREPLAGGFAGNGADASANASGKNTSGSSDIYSSARAGQGGSSVYKNSAGNGGNAVNSAKATTTQTDKAAYAQGLASGGSGGMRNSQGFIYPTINVSNGGNAESYSEAIATAAAATANDMAVGGRAGHHGHSSSDSTVNGGLGGNAVSKAYAAGKGSANQVRATAHAKGGYSSNTFGINPLGNGGAATANASAKGEYYTFATATTRSWQDRSTGNTSAKAKIESTTNLGNATATSSNKGIDIAKYLYSRGSAPANGITKAESGFRLGGAIHTVDQKTNALATGTVLPDAASVVAELTDNANVAQHFDFDNGSTALAYLNIGGGSSDTGDATAINTYYVDYQLQLDMSGIAATPQNLLLGLMNTSVIGSDFQSLHFDLSVEGTTRLSVNFLDTVSATSFFEDNLVNLGAWKDYISTDNILNIDLNLNIHTDDLDSRFYTDILLGVSSVPLPATAWLFISAFMGLLGFLPRRKG